jgi:S-adenosylmethionine:tRNA ribosyltransferase-isomerase
LAERSASRLLVLDGATGGLADRNMGDLPSYLRAGDLLVFNDTRVVAARIVGAKPSGGRVEIFLERVTVKAVSSYANAGREALVQLRASKPIREGLEISTAGGVVRVIGREDELWRVETPGDDALEFFETWGEVPLPPYIHRSADASDRERYQSIFAREKGAVAAPTASLHFDAPLVAKLEAMGVERAFVTLHVGAGTFQPLRTEDLDAHRMHAERVTVSAATWDAIQRTRAAGGRVIAVGTTVVRSLESAVLQIVGHAALGDSDQVPLSAQDTVGDPSDSGQVLRRTQGTVEGSSDSGQVLPRTQDTVGGPSDSGQVLRRTQGTVGGSSDSGQVLPRTQGTLGGSSHSGQVLPGTQGTVGGPSDSGQVLRGAQGTVGGSSDSGQVLPRTQGMEDGARLTRDARATNIWSGETRLFIRPGFEFRLVDAMVTNFHLPESTLLMLVSAFAGREHVLAAYAHAVRERYRFFSYGDAMLVMPTQTRPTKTQPTRAFS